MNKYRVEITYESIYIDNVQAPTPEKAIANVIKNNTPKAIHTWVSKMEDLKKRRVGRFNYSTSICNTCSHKILGICRELHDPQDCFQY